MSELQVGDKIKDNDPRMGTRVLTITKAHPNGAMVEAKSATGRIVSILRNRIYTDGKPRKSGFSKVGGDGNE